MLKSSGTKGDELENNREKFSPLKNRTELPEELLNELNLTSAEDDRIIDILKQGGGILNVSEILIGYYQLFNEVYTRNKMVSTLYRMTKKKLIVRTGKKGEYNLLFVA